MKKKIKRKKIINISKSIQIKIKILNIIFALLFYFLFFKAHTNFRKYNQNRGNYIKIININNYSYKDSFPLEIKTNIEGFINYGKLEIEKQSKSINEIKIIAVKFYCHLGNCLLILNNIIAFCELIKCENIILWKNFELIKNNIYLKNYNITIKPYIDIDCSKKMFFVPIMVLIFIVFQNMDFIEDLI